MIYSIDYRIQDLTSPDQTRTVHFATLELDSQEGWMHLGRAVMALHQLGSTIHKPSQIIEVITTASRSL